MHSLSQVEEGRLVRCAAVVVTYHPTPENIRNLPQIARQFGTLYVVDNGSPEPTRRSLELLANSNSCFTFISLRENVGLAAGMNAGMKAARADGYSWVALFDQDTEVCPDYASHVGTAMRDGGVGDRVALFAPRHIHPVTGEDSAYSPIIHKSERFSEIAATITSGSILDSTIHERLGGFAEELFIDFVDYEYSFRLRENGWRQIQINNLKLIHQVGESAKRCILGIPVKLNLHSPLRHYFIMRNRIVLLKRYGLSHPRWAMRELVFGTTGWLLLSLSGPEHRKVFLNGCRGIVDAMRGRLGPA